MEADLYTPPPSTNIHNDLHTNAGTDGQSNQQLTQKMEQLLYRLDHMSHKVDTMSTELTAVKRILAEHFNQNF